MSSVNSAKKFIRSSHIVGLNEFHFEWCTKYRYECMSKEYLNKDVENCIRQAAHENNILIRIIAVGSDHVHLDAIIPFNMDPSTAIGVLKGRSAYLIFRMHPNFRKRYPRGHFWSIGKFSRSMSGVSSDVVGNYIKDQQFEKLHESVDLAKEEFRQMSISNFL